MIREYQNTLRQGFKLLDIGILFISLFITPYIVCVIKNDFNSCFQKTPPVGFLLISIPLGLLIFSWQKLYGPFRLNYIREIIKRVVYSLFAFALSLSAFLFILKYKVSRMYLFSYVFCVGLFVLTTRMLVVKFLHSLRSRGKNLKYILIVGVSKRVEKFINLIHSHKEWGFLIKGFVDKDASLVGKNVFGYPVLGRIEDLEKILCTNIIDYVVFIIPRRWFSFIEEAVLVCEKLGKKVFFSMDVFNPTIGKWDVSDFGGVPMLHLQTTKGALWQHIIKRVIDIVVSLVLLVVLSPLFLVISILIKLTSPGPVFFKQVRCGLNGRKFVLYKFRSMVQDAEKRLEELRRHNEMEGPVFKMKDDPRVTPLGKILRRMSLDELPQLWNVLKGDMSLVGPRPPLPEEVEKYDLWHRRRLSMKPGITCLWQVNGRNQIKDFNKWMELDLRYIDNWSLSLDFKILLKTIPAVFTGRGAN